MLKLPIISALVVNQFWSNVAKRNLLTFTESDSSTKQTLLCLNISTKPETHIKFLICCILLLLWVIFSRICKSLLFKSTYQICLFEYSCWTHVVKLICWILYNITKYPHTFHSHYWEKTYYIMIIIIIYYITKIFTLLR